MGAFSSPLSGPSAVRLIFSSLVEHCTSYYSLFSLRVADILPKSEPLSHFTSVLFSQSSYSRFSKANVSSRKCAERPIFVYYPYCTMLGLFSRNLLVIKRCMLALRNFERGHEAYANCIGISENVFGVVDTWHPLPSAQTHTYFSTNHTDYYHECFC
jgi:hypothetical protein